MALPATLFVLNFVGGTLQGGATRSNAVYDLQGLIVSAALEAVFAVYAIVAVAASHRPLRDTLALRRTPLWPAVGTVAVAVVVVIVSGALLDPIFNGGAQQGIEPTHSPTTTHQWVSIGVAAFALVLVAPVAEELLFRGLGFAAFGPVAVPVTALLFGLAHGLPALLVEVTVAGLVLAEVRRRTGSVLPGMAVHMTFNAAALAIAFATLGVA
jgi:membrane protease YdiL (CAAX protease family)